ncbi:hypothetical protein [Pantoea ananatis]|uniref:hypothetical protein n=1 Tax=Pantoea ananas TaxID=553 RepID=UPI0039B86992
MAGSDTRTDNSATTGSAALMFDAGGGLRPYVSVATSFYPNVGTDAQGAQFDRARAPGGTGVEVPGTTCAGATAQRRRRRTMGGHRRRWPACRCHAVATRDVASSSVADAVGTEVPPTTAATRSCHGGCSGRLRDAAHRPTSHPGRGRRRSCGAAYRAVAGRSAQIA